MSRRARSRASGMSAAQFFAYGADLMVRHPPHITDWSRLACMKRIGLEPGKPFDLAKSSSTVRAGLERVPPDGLKAIRAKYNRLGQVINGWQMQTESMGVWGDNYLKRAVIALTGLGANQPEDAIYPQSLTDADGNPLLGACLLRPPLRQVRTAAGGSVLVAYDV